MSSRVHLLIASLQVSLWFSQAYLLDQVSPVAWIFLGSFLYCHLVHTITLSSHMESLSHRWLSMWAGWQLLRLVFPVVFESSPPDVPIFLNTLAFSFPSLILLLMPVQAPSVVDEDELPLKP